jgi:hypothetical protein
MQLRHISPRSSDWMDAMDEGAGSRGWEKLGPEERMKLRQDDFSAVWAREAKVANPANVEDAETNDAEEDDYGWGAPSASR